MPYLICEECDGYYHIQSSDSIEEQYRCYCGGELLYVDKLEDYFDYDYESDNEDNEYYYTRRSGKKKYILVFSMILLPTLIFASIYSDNMGISSHPEIIGSEQIGIVTKEVYSPVSAFSGEKKKIAVVSGIHPRETLSISVADNLVKNIHLEPDQELVHYSINVRNNPSNYRVGRSNGEKLAAKFILPDILKSDYDLVIVFHDHAPGYGEGYYIVTPKMDGSSVFLAENVKETVYGFRYYKSNNNTESSSSNAVFTKLVAANGIKAFVYEIPEDDSYAQAYKMTQYLIYACFQLI
ncbi:MAG: hypothetical protein QME14_01860 [Methanobacteriaceae archaeon]|nr:hypothetical protein [Methanobacteriaceae archaeon]